MANLWNRKQCHDRSYLYITLRSSNIWNFIYSFEIYVNNAYFISSQDMEEINTIDDLALKLSNVQLPWNEFCPNKLTQWLNIFACSHGTTKELTLLGILPTVGAPLGKTELKLFSTHKERGNMYFIALAPSGAGKTPAAQIMSWQAWVLFSVVFLV